MPLILSFLLSLTACGTASQADFVGSFEAKYSFGTDTLDLNADGTYKQVFAYTDGRTITNQGTWQFPAFGDDSSRIKISQMLIVDDGFDRPAKQITKLDSILPYSNWFGELRLTGNQDLYIDYVKSK